VNRIEPSPAQRGRFAVQAGSAIKATDPVGRRAPQARGGHRAIWGRKRGRHVEPAALIPTGSPAKRAGLDEVWFRRSLCDCDHLVVPFARRTFILRGRLNGKVVWSATKLATSGDDFGPKMSSIQEP
jgi:hypothetical protein